MPLIKSWFGSKVKLTAEQRVHRTIAFMTSELVVRAGVEGAAAGDKSGKTSRKILRKVRDNIIKMLDSVSEAGEQ